MLIDIFGVKIWSGYTAQEIKRRLVARGLSVIVNDAGPYFKVKKTNESKIMLIRFNISNKNGKMNMIVEQNDGNPELDWTKSDLPHPRVLFAC